MRPALIGLLIGLLIGYALSWAHLRPDPVAVVAKPAVRLAGGGLALAVRTDKAPAPAQPVAKGSTVKDVGAFVVRPKAVQHVVAGQQACSCDAIAVHYTALADVTGQPVMQVSADNAEIVGGDHWPIAELKMKPEPKWAVGITRDLETHRFGGFVDRDFGAVRTGIEAEPGTIRLRAGVRFW